ncbi:MAG: ATP/GTP-binding protein [Methanomassiliicoccales archaeon]
MYFIGTAGSGKSTLVYAFEQWMERQGLDCVTLNLDPGAEQVPYEPDVDIRDWVRLTEVMEDYGLGPNGAQVVCSDLMALNVKEWGDVVQGFESNYLLIDTPGQMELFTFRQSSSVIMDHLGRESSYMVFLSDPHLSRMPNGFVSNLMLCALTHFRFSVPILNTLSKVDLLSNEERERVMEWSASPDTLNSDLMEQNFNSQSMINLEFFKAMENVGMFRRMVPVSSEEMEGMGDVYDGIQQSFEGGEDLSPD